MSEARIPFAIRKSDHRLVEVSDVVRGQRCGCVCPSCKQGVIAKQGNINVWHFAHDQNAIDKPVKECDISFNSCCRQYVIALLLQGDITKLCTPGLVISEPSLTLEGNELTAHVTESHTLENITATISTKYDIGISVASYNLFLFFSYKGRHYPVPPEDKTAGLLAVDISTVNTAFYSQKTTPGLLKELLTKLMAFDTRHKRWLYHPREENVRSQLCKKVQQEAMSSIPESHETVIGDNNEILERSQNQDVVNKPARDGQYRCFTCNITWPGKEYIDAHCPKCHEYILSIFTADD